MSIFTTKLIKTKKFYATYKKWSEEKGFPVLERENLGKKVFVCYRTRTPVYCCFLWETDSKMALVGFPISNRSIPFNLREGGLEAMFGTMSEILEKKGYTKIWTTSGTKPVMEALAREGFINADKNVNVYIKML